MSIENEAMMEDQGLDFAAADLGTDEDRPQSRLSDLFPDFRILLSKTGEGSIENYLDHPLNIGRSRGKAQVIRGLSGIAGDLDYALIDIALGTIEIIREGRKNVAVTE